MRITIALMSLVALALVASPAEALPKRPTAPGAGGTPVLNNNCSSAQLHTDIGSQCVAKGNAEVMEGSSTYHFAYCSSSGAVLCCLTDGFRILDASCTVGMSGENKGFELPKPIDLPHSEVTLALR